MPYLVKFLKCIFVLFAFLIGINITYAQKINTDSLRQARMKAIEETRAAQKRSLDSAKASRQHVIDSMTSSRKRVTDSMASIRKYKESKKYQDSVVRARQGKLDSMREVRTTFSDSLRNIRQHTTDSITAIRKATTDSLRTVQKGRADSLGAIRKYRESKRYKDSVAVTRQNRLDSMTAVRKAYNDSAFAARKQITDEANAIRKASQDSATAVRTQYLDSLKAVRKQRTDSFAVAKEKRERLKKSNEKLKGDKMQLALELKIKKKHEAWNNEKMLKKQWNAPRKAIQNTFTRYNYYFNADKRMDEALENMLRMSKEGYDSLIALYPFDPDRDSATLAPDMDSIIQKASLGVQIHDPRTKWADDLYMLLGQAYYYKGNYENAIASFRYIISVDQQNKLKEQRERLKHGDKRKIDATSIVDKEEDEFLDFLKHRPVHNEAILWLARVYTEAHQESNANAILDLLANEKDLPERLKGRVAIEKAYVALGKNDYRNASPQLAIAANDKEIPDWLRIRAAYLNGQILFQQANYTEAANQFAKVVDLNPKLEMDFYARKNRAYSLMEQGGNQDEATASLKHMLKDGKYAPYYEQIYYVLGRLAANSGDIKYATDYLRKSLASPKSTKRQKAFAFASLGNLYYDAGDYESAKLSYDSAFQLERYAVQDSLVLKAAKRSTVLDKITKPMSVIRTQDSLLRMAGMTEKERQAVAKKYLRSLEQKKADSAFAAANNAGKSEEAEPAEITPVGNWYFSNPNQVSQGSTDFKRKWGNRQNVDNWRRSSGSVGGGIAGGQGSSSNGTTAEEEEEEAATAGGGGLTESALLAVVPLTPQSQEEARKKIQRAYVDLGDGYINAIEDYPRATGALDTLDNRFVAHQHKAEVLYMRYQIALKQNKLPDAQRFSASLLQQFPESKWAKLIAPPEEEPANSLLASIPVANYYDETYGLMMQRNYDAVLERAREGQKTYKNSAKNAAYLKRFRIMEAIALAGSGNYTQADTLISAFISSNPTDSLKDWAETVMLYIKRNKPTPPPVIKDTTAATSAGGITTANQPVKSDTLANRASLPVAKPVTNPVDTASANIASTPPPVPTGTVVDDAPAAYTYNPKEEHYMIFYFPKSESRAMGVKAGISDFNVFKYGGQGLTTSLKMLRADQGVITVRKFTSAAAAKNYMSSLRSNALIFKEYKPSEYQMFPVSASNFLKMEADKDVPGYLKFYKANYK